MTVFVAKYDQNGQAYANTKGTTSTIRQTRVDRIHGSVQMFMHVNDLTSQCLMNVHARRDEISPPCHASASSSVIVLTICVYVRMCACMAAIWLMAEWYVLIYYSHVVLPA